MKKFASVIFISSAFLFNSCDPAATFDRPQPYNIKPLSSFPEHLQGKYLSTDQSSVITIADSLITRHYDFDVKTLKDSLDSSYRLSGDTFIDKRDNTKEPVIVKNDTVIRHEEWTDTLFCIASGNILKKYKGYYFLNISRGNNQWEVKELSLKKGRLSLGCISDEKDIEKLNELTETNADTVSTHFSLKRRQFKKFVRQGGFSDREIFTRITEPGI